SLFLATRCWYGGLLVHDQQSRLRMKITDAKVFVCSPGRNFVTLKVFTDEGIYGLGDGTLNGRELSVASYLTDHVIPCIIGRDPFQTEDIWQYLYRGAYWRRGPVTMSAIAAVDVALWDIKAKALDTPLAGIFKRLCKRWGAIWIKDTWQCGRSAAYRVCQPPMVFRKTRCFMSPRREDCRRRMSGRRKSTFSRRRSCSTPCARNMEMKYTCCTMH